MSVFTSWGATGRIDQLASSSGNSGRTHSEYACPEEMKAVVADADASTGASVAAASPVTMPERSPGTPRSGTAGVPNAARSAGSGHVTGGPPASVAGATGAS